MIKQSKKLVNKLVRTSAAVAMVGTTSLSHAVHAEELKPVEPKPEVTPVEKPVETVVKAQPKTVAEAQALVAVATQDEKVAAEAVTEAETAVKAQEDLVETARKAEETANKAEETAEKDLAEAEKIVAEASPEKIAAIESTLSAKTDETEDAKTVLAQAETAALTQATELANAQTEATEAQKAVEAAQTEVNRLEAAIKDPAILANQKAEAEQQVAHLESELTAAQTALTTTKNQTANAVTQEIVQKQAEITRLNAQIQDLSNQITQVERPVDVTGGNRLVAPSGFPVSTVRQLIAAGGNASHELVNRAIAETRAVSGDGLSINSYQAISADLARSVDPANLSSDVQNELATFAAAMINPIRQQLGLSQVEVVAGAQEFAKNVARKVTARGQLPSTYHDFSAISSSAAESGLRPSDTWAYEALGMSGGRAVTVNDLKAGIYQSLKIMLFEDHEHAVGTLGHLRNLLRNDAATVYMGVGTSTAYSGYGNYNQHIMMIPATNVVSSSFNRTVVTPTRRFSEAADNSAQIAVIRGQITNLTNSISTLQGYQANIATHPTVIAATDRVTTTREQLTKTRDKVAQLTTELANVGTSNAANRALLATAQGTLAGARTRLAAAQTLLTTEKAESQSTIQAVATAKADVERLVQEVNSLTILLAKYQNPNLLEDTKTSLEAAKRAKAGAAEALQSERDKLVGLNKTLAEARTILSEKQAALREAIALLNQFLPKLEATPLRTAKKPSQLPPSTKDKQGDALSTPTKLGGGAGSANGSSESRTATISHLTNQVLAQKTASLSVGAASVQTVQSAGTATPASQGKTLPNTGDKASMVASVLGSMMLSGALAAGIKRREE